MPDQSDDAGARSVRGLRSEKVTIEVGAEILTTPKSADRRAAAEPAKSPAAKQGTPAAKKGTPAAKKGTPDVVDLTATEAAPAKTAAKRERPDAGEQAKTAKDR